MTSITPPNVHSPSAQDLEDIARAHKLNPTQKQALSRCLDMVVAEIHAHAAMRQQGWSPREIRVYVRTLSNHLDKLEQHLKQPNPAKDRLLGALFGEVLGRLISHDGLERLLGQIIPAAISIHVLGSRNGQGRSGPYRALERDLIPGRREMSRKHAAVLLPKLTAELRRPLEAYLAAQKLAGGSPGKIYRNHAVARLALAYEEIFGARPTSTPRGRFMGLCDSALASIGLDTDGLESAAQRILRRLHHL